MDRRGFLRSTLTVGTGLALSSSVPAQTDIGKKETIDVALLGAGRQGEVLLGACVKMQADVRIRFRAVCDLWQDLNLRRVVGLLGRCGRRFRGPPA